MSYSIYVDSQRRISVDFQRRNRQLLLAGFVSLLFSVFTFTTLYAKAEVEPTANSAPLASNDSYTLTEDTGLIVPLSVGVLHNDSDAENDPLSAVLKTVPNQGTLDLHSDGSFVYTPDPNYAGSDTFSYVANDGQSDSNVVTVHLQVTGVNDPPTVASQNLAIDEDEPIDVILNARDVDGDPLRYTVLVSPTLATLIGTGDTVVYYPDENVSGNDSYVVEVCEETVTALCATATISVTIRSVNDTPVVDDQSLTTDEDIALVIPLGAVDVEGDLISYAVTIPPALGTLSALADVITYTPDANLSGYDSFVIEVCDNAPAPLCDEGLIEVEILPVNDAPTAEPQSVSLLEDSALPITLHGSDVEGDLITYTVTSQPQHGILAGKAPTLTYTPTANFNGSDHFTFQTNDGSLNSEAALVTITVTAVNDAPVLTNQQINGTEDTPLTITLPQNDIDGDPLTYVLANPPLHGTLGALKPTLIYTPNANYNGSDAFSLRASDGISLSNLATVTVSLSAVNDPPTANDQNVVTDEDTPRTVTLSGGDVDGDALSHSIIDAPRHGTLSGTSPNLTYTPEVNYYGSDRFTFISHDSSADSDVATVNITVNSVNDSPVANPQKLTTQKNNQRSITLTGSDVDGDTLSFAVVTAPLHGTLLGMTPNLSYTPTTEYTGTDSLRFEVCDPGALCNQALVTITIGLTNTAPVAISDAVTTTENSPVAITLQGTDAENEALIYAVLASPLHGTLSGSTPNLTYTPNLNYNGSDAFTFHATDGLDDSNLATILITVTPVNNPPTANAQQVTTAEDTEQTIKLTGGDVDGDSLTYAVLNQPLHGQFGGSAPLLTYTPDANYHGSDTFTFQTNDGELGSSSATVTLTITSINDAPVASDQSYTVNEDADLILTLSANDVEGDNLNYSVVDAPLHGQLSGAAPALTYHPDANYYGNDSFTFVSNDGQVDSNAATVSLTIVAQNDPPIAQAQQRTLNEDQPLAITLSASDADGDALRYAIVMQPAHGLLSGNPPNLLYTPDANFHGSDAFSFKVEDGKVNSTVAVIALTIAPVNDPPKANSQSKTLAEDKDLELILSGSDIDGDTLTYLLVKGPTHGALTGNLPTLTYRPNTNYHGADSIVFKTNDGHVNSPLATVNLTVTSVNDAPSTIPQATSTQEDTAMVIPLSGRDADGDDLTLILLTAPTHGILSGLNQSINGADVAFMGTLLVTYTPDLNFFGNDSFRYKVNDGLVDSIPVTVEIAINPVNDVPTAPAQTVETTQEKALAILLNGSDVEDRALSYSIVTQPSHGILSGALPNPTYTPEKGFAGEDSFAFKVTDSAGASVSATITITVVALPDNPEYKSTVYLPVITR